VLNLGALNLRLRDFAYFDEFGSNLKFIGKFAAILVKFIFWLNLSLLQILISFVGLFLIYLKR